MSESLYSKENLNIEVDYKYNYQQTQAKIPDWAEKYQLRDLPRLPIPPLQGTLTRYIDTVKPLLTDEELENTKKKVAKFLETDGPKIDAQLKLLRKEAQTSWLEGFWDTMYLEWRDSIAIHINPCFVLQDDPTPERNHQVPRAASLIYSTLWFINSIRTNSLAPDLERTTRLCMHQYSVLFGTTRIPQYRRDKLITDYNSKHIAVVARDQYYWFNAYDEGGKQLEQEELERYLQHILEDARVTAEKGNPIPPVGMLTAADRETWTGCYNQLLLAGPQNKEYLEKLTTALFIVCLDNHMPSNLDETGKIVLHSDGRNRWFDKSIQLVVCRNGKAGINMEHSAFDGHTTLRYAEDMFNHSVRTRCDSPSPFSAFDVDAKANPVPPAVHKMDFVLTPELIAEIDHTTIEFNQLAGRCATRIVHFSAYGRRFCTNYNYSPDAWVQMAYQLTYYRIHGTVGSTYESAMTKKFFHGRTECMRSLSNDAVALVKVCAAPSSTALEQIKALREACKTHTKLVSRCKSGEGVDRHLYGLQNLAKQLQQRVAGFQMPELFTDIAWSRMRYDVMSTSNCGGYSLASFGFGPVVPDGYGLGYIIKDKCMHIHITNFDAAKAKQYANLLEQTMLEMAQLVANGTPVRLSSPTTNSKSKL